VESRAGYQNLCRLITQMKLRVPKIAKPGACAATLEELQTASGGLFCLTGDEHGPLAAALARGGIEAGRACLEQLRSIFGADHGYGELQRPHHREQEARNQATVKLALSWGLPLLATKGAAYARAAQREVLAVFPCTRHHPRLDLAGRLLARNP